jgi:DNA-binding CsgD family transcriptional regulator
MDHRGNVGALIDGIYQAGMDASRWPTFMESLASTLHAGYGTLWVHDFGETPIQSQDDGLEDISVTVGLDEPARAQYQEHYAALNVWVPNTSQLKEGTVTVSSALYPDRLLEQTEFYDGYLRPHDLFFALGSSVVKRGTRDVKMGFVRSAQAGAYSGEELRLVRQLMPHLKNAVVLNRQLHRLRLLAGSAVAALELVPIGVILLTQAGLLMHANCRAHELSRRTRSLDFAADGSIHAASAGATSTLQDLICGALRSSLGKSLEDGGTLQLVGPGGRKLQVLVTPLPAWSGWFGGEAMAAIFCSDPDAVVGRLSQRLQAIYRMTSAEAQLTEALVNGQSLSQYAQARCVTMNTLRTQLKSATAKAGAKRQADLVRIVLTGPAIFNTPG